MVWEGSKSKRVRREQAPDVPLCMAPMDFIGAWRDVMCISGVGEENPLLSGKLSPIMQPAHAQRS